MENRDLQFFLRPRFLPTKIFREDFDGGTLEVLAMVRHVDHQESHREDDLPLAERNLGLIESSRCANLPQSSRKTIEGLSRTDDNGVLRTIIQTNKQR